MNCVFTFTGGVGDDADGVALGTSLFIWVTSGNIVDAIWATFRLFNPGLFRALTVIADFGGSIVGSCFAAGGNGE